MVCSASAVAFCASLGDCQSEVTAASAMSLHIPTYAAVARCFAISAGCGTTLVDSRLDDVAGGRGSVELQLPSSTSAADVATVARTASPKFMGSPPVMMISSRSGLEHHLGAGSLVGR